MLGFKEKGKKRKLQVQRIKIQVKRKKRGKK